MPEETSHKKEPLAEPTYRNEERVLPGGLSKMYYDEDEIDIFEYLQYLRKHVWKMLLFSFAVTVLSVFYALSLDNLYRADVLLMPVTNGESGGRRLPGGLETLGALAGIQLNKTAASTDAKLEILKTRVFINKVIEENNLMPLLFQMDWDSKTRKWVPKEVANNLAAIWLPVSWGSKTRKGSPKEREETPEIEDGINMLKDSIKINKNSKSGLIIITLDNKDPNRAAQWLMLLVNALNHHLKKEVINEGKANIGFLEKELKKTSLTEMRRTLFVLIEEQTRQMMLAGTREDYAFKIVDPAVVPRDKYKPNRKRIVIAAAFGSLFFAAFFFLAIESFKKMNRRHEKKIPA